MIFCCIIFCFQKGSFPAEIRSFKQFPTGHLQLTHTIKSYAIWHTHIYVCVGRGEVHGDRKRRIQETWYNFKQGNQKFCWAEFFYWVVGSWGVTLTFWCIMYHVLISSMELPFFKKIWTQIQSIKQAFRCFYR